MADTKKTDEQMLSGNRSHRKNIPAPPASPGAEEHEEYSEEENKSETEGEDDGHNEESVGEDEVEDEREVARVELGNIASGNEEESEEKKNSFEAESVPLSSEELAKIPEESSQDEASAIQLNSANTRPKSHDDLFAKALIDSEVFKEMMEASNRCTAVEKEISQLQEELKELQQKEDLSEIDKGTLEEKRKNLMEKMGQLDSITSNIQETLGLVDPSNDMFLKAFEAFIESQPSDMKNTAKKDEEERTKRMVKEWQAWENQVPEENRLDLPQEEYPEDRNVKRLRRIRNIIF